MNLEEVKRIAEAVGWEIEQVVVKWNCPKFRLYQPFKSPVYYDSLAPIKRLLAEECRRLAGEKQRIWDVYRKVFNRLEYSETLDMSEGFDRLATRLEQSASEDEKQEPTIPKTLRLLELERAQRDLCQLEQIILDALIEFGERIEKLEGKG